MAGSDHHQQSRGVQVGNVDTNRRGPGQPHPQRNPLRHGPAAHGNHYRGDGHLSHMPTHPTPLYSVQPRQVIQTPHRPQRRLKPRRVQPAATTIPAGPSATSAPQALEHKHRRTREPLPPAATPRTTTTTRPRIAGRPRLKVLLPVHPVLEVPILPVNGVHRLRADVPQPLVVAIVRCQRPRGVAAPAAAAAAHRHRGEGPLLLLLVGVPTAAAHGLGRDAGGERPCAAEGVAHGHGRAADEVPHLPLLVGRHCEAGEEVR